MLRETDSNAKKDVVCEILFTLFLSKVLMGF